MAAPFGDTSVPAKYQAQVLAAAATYGVPPAFLAAQINAESGFNANAVSPDGAIGIAQFLPGTAVSVGLNPHDPMASIIAMAKLMAHYKSQFGTWEKALYAYHDGPGKVDSPGPAGIAYAKTILSKSGITSGADTATGEEGISPVASLTDPFQITEKLFATFQKPDAWKRVGYYLVGMLLITIGIILISGKRAVQLTESALDIGGSGGGSGGSTGSGGVAKAGPSE
jgi:hypothetical protein